MRKETSKTTAVDSPGRAAMNPGTVSAIGIPLSGLEVAEGSAAAAEARTAWKMDAIEEGAEGVQNAKASLRAFESRQTREK